MKLSRVERWILANQFAVLAKLYPEEATSYEKMREIVVSGYELHYDWISEHIYDESSTMTDDECKEVLDILDMFSSLKRAYQAMPDKVDGRRVKFLGFDGNNETKYLAYTRFLVDSEGKFTDVDRGDQFNSHAPLLPRYRQMLEEWQKSSDKHDLTEQDVIRIVSDEPDV